MSISTPKNSIECLVKHPEVRVSMGQAGREYVEQEYDLVVQVEKLENIYNEFSDVKLHA